MAKLPSTGDRPHDYISYHSHRKYLLETCIRCVPARESRVLDIDRSPFSYNLAEYYADVSTLGFSLEGIGVHTPGCQAQPKMIPHLVFDLNRTQDLGSWPKLPEFDLIVIAEVLEHLHTAPELVFLLLRSILTENGIPICQTPNAAALTKSIKIVGWNSSLRKNPVLRRGSRSLPGYTRRELREIGEVSGFETALHEFEGIFRKRQFRSETSSLVRNEWILRWAGPYIGKRAVEVGAGMGDFAAALLRATPVSKLVLVEPAENLFPNLCKAICERNAR